MMNSRGGCFTLDEKMGNTYVFEEMANTLAQRDYKQPQAVIIFRPEQTIKVDGGVLRSLLNQESTKHPSV